MFYLRSETLRNSDITTPRSIIEIEGVDYSKHLNGFNVVVINSKTGVVESSVNFRVDVDQSATMAMVNYLDGIPGKTADVKSCNDHTNTINTKSTWNTKQFALCFYIFNSFPRYSFFLTPPRNKVDNLGNIIEFAEKSVLRNHLRRFVANQHCSNGGGE